MACSCLTDFCVRRFRSQYTGFTPLHLISQTGDIPAGFPQFFKFYLYSSLILTSVSPLSTFSSSLLYPHTTPIHLLCFHSEEFRPPKGNKQTAQIVTIRQGTCPHIRAGVGGTWTQEQAKAPETPPLPLLGVPQKHHLMTLSYLQRT